MDILGACNGASCHNCFKGILKPQKGLSTIPLVLVGVISLVCFLIVMCLSLNYGFRVAGVSNHLASYGTVVVLVVDFAYIYCTVKILFCVKSITFPTRQEVKELRDTIVHLTSFSSVGIILIIVAYSWFSEIEEARDDLMSDMNISLRSNTSDLVETDKPVVNMDTMVFDNNNSLSTKALVKDFTNLIKLGATVSDIEFFINALQDKKEVTDDNGTEIDISFFSLLFSCLSFCLAGVVIISATLFEKKCTDALDSNRKINSRSSNSFPSEGDERVSLYRATNSRTVPAGVAKVHEDTTTPEEEGLDTVCNGGETVETKVSEEEDIIVSTSPYRLPSKEPETFSTSSSDQDQSLTTGKLNLGQPPSTLMALYPQRGSGRGHYKCSICNSVLEPSLNVQKPRSVSATRLRKKKKRSARNLGGQTLAKAVSQPQDDMEEHFYDIPCTQEKPELRTRPTATNVEESQTQHGAEHNGSDENLGPELFPPFNSSFDGENGFEMTKM